MYYSNFFAQNSFAKLKNSILKSEIPSEYYEYKNTNLSNLSNLSKGSVRKMISKIGGQYNLDALNGKKSRKNVYYDNNANKSDEADFSSFAVHLSKYNAELKNIPDVREDLVANLKTQIESGDYVPPLDKLASSLIIAGMLDNV